MARRKNRSGRSSAIRTVYLDFDGTLLDHADYETFRRWFPGGKLLPERGRIFNDVPGGLEALRGKGLDLQIITLTRLLSREEKLEKISHFGLDRYFSHTHVVTEKTPETYRHIVKAPARSVMVGDSLKYDILPAVAIGMRAFHLVRRGRLPDHRSPRAVAIRSLNELSDRL